LFCQWRQAKNCQREAEAVRMKNGPQVDNNRRFNVSKGDAENDNDPEFPKYLANRLNASAM
jgi:hypothetical protein